MKVLMVSAYFPPEIGSASHLFYEIGGEFVRRGHDVTVLTGYPTYNVDPASLPLQYRSGLSMTETMNGMTVVRVRNIGLPRNISTLRGIGQVTMALTFAYAGLFLNPKRQDVVVVYSPPLFLGLTGLILRVFRSAKVVLNVQDLFPQQAIDLGLIRNGALVKAFRYLESFLYRNVDAVAVHSAGNKGHVERHGGTPARTYVIPNVVDTKIVTPGPRMNAFRRVHGVPESEFIVSFAGVLGYNQDVDTIIHAAGMLQSVPTVVFYIVGSGVEKDRLVELAKGLPNVRFLPMIPKEEYIELLHASDVGLVTLRKSVKTPVVPSKILSLMAAARPMVASLPLDGDAPELIKEAQCGICVEPEDPAKFAEAVLALYNDRERAAQMGTNGRRFAEDNLSLATSVAMYERVFGEIAGDVRTEAYGRPAPAARAHVPEPH